MCVNEKLAASWCGRVLRVGRGVRVRHQLLSVEPCRQSGVWWCWWGYCLIGVSQAHAVTVPLHQL